MRNKKLPLLVASAWLLSTALQAQELKESYIKWWPTHYNSFEQALQRWPGNHKVTEDDNFFISRVKPKTRFTNKNTQVNKNLEAANDKRLAAWLPMNSPGKNALPDGVYDSEVFSMWNYVSHWGNWTAPLGRIPAALLDVAHKNGVAVSSVWGIPWGGLSTEWQNRILTLSSIDANTAAEFMYYFGQDGLGYNSEFNTTQDVVSSLTNFHVELVKAMKDKNPIFENMWYDGTSDYGDIKFDQGLAGHNDDNFGKNGKIASSLFFNYNWNSDYRMRTSVNNAKNIQRDPLYLYCGINMQGGEPRSGQRWPQLAKYPLSIGLWGAHSRNMFWESRNEKGSAPEVQQRTYLQRIERWFTGSTFNPANSPALNNSLNYGLSAGEFGGMSPMMTAKSTLAWNLSEEPFITYFNLGNGKFFNWNGERQHNREWYNIGVQDYLPTWRWWFASSLLQKDVPDNGLKAEFTWDDAYMGGSCMRVYGNTSSEYLHLFKTEYALNAGDVITVRYKHVGGTANAKLVLTAKDAETTAINDGDLSLLSTSDVADDEVWKEKTITVGSQLAGKTLALIALQFENAQNLNIRLGEVSIVRGTSATPQKPEITSSALLAFNQSGADGKIIFNMANDKPAGQPCYNTDVKTSLFKLWAEPEGGQKILMGVTTSWAGMMYSIPTNGNGTTANVRLGVSAVSLDMKTESDIAWTQTLQSPTYVYSNEVQASKTVIKPNESFSIGYVDKKHDAAEWKLIDANGATVFTGTGNTVDISSGLANTGSYTLEVKGKVYSEDGSSNEQTISYPAFLAVTSEASGALPQIYTLTANGQNENIQVAVNEEVNLAYTGRAADGVASRGLNLAEKGLVFKATDAGLTTNNTAWTMSFWLKFNTVAAGATQFLDMRHQGTGWPQNNWGSIWSTYDPAAKELGFTIRKSNGGGDEHTQKWNIEFKPGVWTHFAVAMEQTTSGVRAKIYVNGKMASAKSYKFGYSTGNGLIPYYQNTTAWWPENHMMLGFGRHQCAAIDGIVDDVKFFNKTLSEEEVAKIMTAENITELNPSAVWTFEDNADTDNWFTSKGTNTVKTARVEMVSGSGEGQGSFRALEPKFLPGSPFAPGQAFVVETKPTWSAPKGTLSDMTGNSQNGTAKVAYAKDGEYKVTLTLTNSYGSDSKVFQVIRVGEPTGIGHVEGTALKTYSIDKDVFVEFAEAGQYTVQVFNQTGMLVANAVKNVTPGAKVHVQVATSGIYILKVVKDHKTARTAKLLCK